MANPQLAAPRLSFIFAARVTVGAPLELGDVAKGSRRIVPITGGGFCGPDLGVAELEARYTLQCDDGTLIHVRNVALRHGPPEIMAALAAGGAVDPNSYYFRGATSFETAAARYAWLTRHVVVCTGQRKAALVALDFYKLH